MSEVDEFMSRLMSNLDGSKDAKIDALVKVLDEILACGSDHELHEAFIRARRVRAVVGEVPK